MEFSKVPKTRVSHGIVEQIREMIINQQLHPGDRLPSERDLMGKFGTSRNPIREALRVLESLGFVSVKPGSGTYVNDPLGSFSTPPSQWSLQHKKVLFNHYEARLIIEPGIAALAAKRATSEDLKNISRAMDELGARLIAGDVLGGMLSDARFHWLIAKSSGNEILQHILETLAKVLSDAWKKTTGQSRSPLAKFEAAQKADPQNPGYGATAYFNGNDNGLTGLFLFGGWKALSPLPGPNPEEAIIEHLKIYNAIAAGDQQAASQTMTAHMERAINDMQDSDLISQD